MWCARDSFVRRHVSSNLSETARQDNRRRRRGGGVPDGLEIGCDGGAGATTVDEDAAAAVRPRERGVACRGGAWRGWRACDCLAASSRSVERGFSWVDVSWTGSWGRLPLDCRAGGMKGSSDEGCINAGHGWPPCEGRWGVALATRGGQPMAAIVCGDVRLHKAGYSF